MIFGIVEYIIMEWTMRMKAKYAGLLNMQVLILKKRRRVLLVSLQSSIGQKSIAELKN